MGFTVITAGITIITVITGETLTTIGGIHTTTGDTARIIIQIITFGRDKAMPITACHQAISV